MSPARRKKLAKLRLSKKKTRGKPAISGLVGTLSFFLFMFVAVLFTTRLWNESSKLSVVFPRKDGNIAVTTFDTTNDSMTTISFPGDTQVEVARQLGTWRLKSVWKLGENEKISGMLLAETITSYFKLPVYVWADEGFEGFLKTSPFSILKSAVAPYKTNLGFGDKVRIGLFSVRVKGFKKVNIGKEDLKFLKYVELVDGEEGYIASGKVSESLLAVFSDPLIANLNVRVQISDSSPGTYVGEEVGEIIQTLGAKVASIDKNVGTEEDCSVSGRDRYMVEKVSLIFSCKNGESAESFDLRVILGESFAKRF